MGAGVKQHKKGKTLSRWDFAVAFAAAAAAAVVICGDLDSISPCILGPKFLHLKHEVYY